MKAFLDSSMKKIFILLATAISLVGLTPTAFSYTQPIRVAVVLGSGGARGYAHIGVIKALEQAGVPIDLIVGASAGSLIGALYADSADAHQLEQIMMSTNLHSFVDINLKPAQAGIITGSQERLFLEKSLKARDFDDLKIKYVAVAAQLTNGESIAISKGPLIPAIQASTALPGLVRPVLLDGKLLIDGGAVDPIPVAVARRYHPQIIIAVDVSQPLSESLPKSSLGAYSRGQDIIWLSLTRYSSQGADIVIHPQVGNAGTFAVNLRQQMVEAGEKATRANLPAILKIYRAARRLDKAPGFPKREGQAFSLWSSPRFHTADAECLT